MYGPGKIYRGEVVRILGLWVQALRSAESVLADWMKIMRKLAIFLFAGIAYCIILPAFVVWGNDLDDGISTYTDESIGADDDLGSSANNINFIVVDAVGKAKTRKSADAKDKGNDAQKNVTNVYDGQSDNNENSVVVEAGSKVDKVYNIVIEK